MVQTLILYLQVHLTLDPLILLTILRSVESIKELHNLITSTFTKDYDKSPFVGYVIAHKKKSDSKSPSLVNPFADKTTIGAKIKSEIQK